MPHVAFVPLGGFRVREPEMLELGMSLPGLRQRAGALAELPSLGLLTLAGMTPEDWTRSWHAAAKVDEELIEAICETSPDLVAISALTASIEEAYVCSDRLRRRGVKTALGGLHVTACPEEAAQRCDGVVVGEGEPVWLDLLADVRAGYLKPLYRAGERISSRGDAKWPTPQFELLGSHPPRFTLQTQRGCPFACDFCAASRLISPFREKPAARIAEELAAIRRISPRPLLELADDNTFAGGRDVEEFFDVLQRAGVRYFTEADWRIGERPEVLRRLAASGCLQVLVGLESRVFRYPGMGAKQAEWNRMLEAVSAIQEAGVAVNGCFIVGAEGETERSLEALTEFVLQSPLADVQITLQTPFPGTELYRRLKDSGRLLRDRGWSSYTLFDVTYQPDRLSVEELERGFRRVLKNIYSAVATERRNRLRKEIMSRRRERITAAQSGRENHE